MKILGKAITVICALFILWAFVSWIDVVWDNCSPNPQHASWNLFVLMTKDEQETTEPEISGQCGNPVNDRVRINCGWVTAVGPEGINLEDEDGSTWYVEVGYPENFEVGEYLCIFYDHNNTLDTDNDDTVIKLWREVW